MNVHLAGLLVLLPLLSSCARSTGTDPAEAGIPMDGFVPRSVWSTVAPDLTVLQRQPMGQIRQLSIHHTETPFPDSIDEAQRLRNIQDYHQKTKLWGDIAYHYLIGPSGTVYEGRAEQFAASSGTVYLTREQWEAAPQDESGRTTAAKPPNLSNPGHSAGHLTICLIGSYGDKLPPEPALKALTILAARKLKEHRLQSDDVFFHREISCWTDCPGQTLYEWFRGPTRKRDGRGPGLEAIEAEWRR